jgi:hypothetical protein
MRRGSEAEHYRVKCRERTAWTAPGNFAASPVVPIPGQQGRHGAATSSRSMAIVEEQAKIV